LKHLAFISCFFVWVSNLFSQSDTSRYREKDLFIAKCIEIPPQYPGGHRALANLLIDNMNYDLLRGEKGLPIRVVVQFNVDTLGNTNHFKILQSSSTKLDQEAIRLLGLLKRWKPATLNGEKIDYLQTQTLIFSREFPAKGQLARPKQNGR
jgi:hypothetical protein